MDSGLAVNVFNQGDNIIACLNKAMAFLIVVASSRFPSTNNQLRTSSNPRNQATIQYSKEGRQGWLNVIIGKVKVTWISNALSQRGLGMLNGLKKRQCWLKHRNPTEDLDAYDSDCDDVFNAKAVLMANLSNYGSDVISEKIDSLEQNLSNQIKEKESLLQTFTVFKNESKEKESKYMDKEIDLEKKIKELDNTVYKVGQSAQTVHMLTKPQVFYDNAHKQALGYQNPFHLKKALWIKPTLFDGSVIPSQHAASPVIDVAETLILEEVSRSKMLAKQNDPMSKEKKVNTNIINYVELNRLSEEFVKIEGPKELPKIYKDQFDSIKNIRALSKEHCDSLIAQLNSKLMENADLKGQIQENFFVTTSLQNELRKLKGKNVLDNFATITNATSIALGMFKLALDPLAPRLLTNRDAYVDYLKYTQDQVDTLRGIVEQAKAKQPLDNALDFSYKHGKRIQELLVYVRDTCPNAYKPSKKLVAVTPMINVKKVSATSAGGDPLSDVSSDVAPCGDDVEIAKKAMAGFETMTSRS
ncbi:hypothetical protein Tco_1216230 [Tanacetum coccineum]